MEYGYDDNYDSYQNNIKPMNNIFKICRSTVKIILPDNVGSSSGFFLKFPRNKKIFYCLMTNQHAITSRIINRNKQIRIIYENETKYLDIILNKRERIIETFFELYNLDITIVEIIPKDKVNESYFLDKYNFEGGNINIKNYIGRKIQVIQYPKGKILSFSEGIILGNHSNNAYIFTHTSQTKHGSSGSPIVLKGDDKVLAIHKGKLTETRDNVGIFVEIIVDIMKDYKRNGNVVEYYENGALKYDGKIKDDKYDDVSGTYVDLNGECYFGEFRNGIKEGKGTEYYNNGEKKYEGNFSYNQYNGNGTLIYENGDYYIGNFVNGKKEGEGTEYYKSKKLKYQGKFSNDQYDDSNGIFYEEYGWYYTGAFFNGKKNGHCLYFNDCNKVVKDGNFIDDEFVEGEDYSTGLNKIKNFFSSVKSTFSPVESFFGFKCKNCEHPLKNHEKLYDGWIKCNDCPEGDNACPYN